MSPRRPVAVLVALAVLLAGALGGATAGAHRVSSGGATAGADPVSSGGATAKAVKRAKVARCAKQRRAARRARLRRGVSRRHLRGCGSGHAQDVVGRKVGGAKGGSPVPAGAAVPPGSPASGGSTGSGGTATPTPVAAPPAAPVVSTLGVTALDSNGFLLRLTKTSVPAGTLTIFFRNGDVSDHNLWISSPGGETVERISDTVGENGGASRTLTVTAGAWRLFCALPDHGAMTRTLTVTP